MAIMGDLLSTYMYIRKPKELGPSLGERFSDQFWAEQAQLGMGFFKDMKTSLELRYHQFAVTQWFKMPFFSRVFAFLEWFIALQFLQSLANRLFIRAGDIQFVSYSNRNVPDLGHQANFSIWKNWSFPLAWFRLRRTLHRLVSAPLSILNTIVHAIFSPLDTLFSFRETKDFRAADKKELALMQLRLNSETDTFLETLSFMIENSDFNGVDSFYTESNFIVLLDQLTPSQRFLLCNKTYKMVNQQKNHTPLTRAIEKSGLPTPMGRKPNIINYLLRNFSNEQRATLLSQPSALQAPQPLVLSIRKGAVDVIDDLLPKYRRISFDKTDPQVSAFTRLLTYLLEYKNQFKNYEVNAQICNAAIGTGTLTGETLVTMAFKYEQAEKLEGLFEHIDTNERVKLCQKMIADKNGGPEIPLIEYAFKYYGNGSRKIIHFLLAGFSEQNCNQLGVQIGYGRNCEITGYMMPKLQPANVLTQYNNLNQKTEKSDTDTTNINSIDNTLEGTQKQPESIQKLQKSML